MGSVGRGTRPTLPIAGGTGATLGRVPQAAGARARSCFDERARAPGRGRPIREDAVNLRGVEP